MYQYTGQRGAKNDGSCQSHGERKTTHKAFTQVVKKKTGRQDNDGKQVSRREAHYTLEFTSRLFLADLKNCLVGNVKRLSEVLVSPKKPRILFSKASMFDFLAHNRASVQKWAFGTSPVGTLESQKDVTVSREMAVLMKSFSSRAKREPTSRGEPTSRASPVEMLRTPNRYQL